MINKTTVTLVTTLITAASAIIVGLIGYYGVYTQPKKDAVMGQVNDANTHKPISNLKVIIEIDHDAQVLYTDDEGHYKVSLNTIPNSITVKIQDDRYEPFSRYVSIDRTGVEPILLTPIIHTSTSPIPTPILTPIPRSEQPSPTKHNPSDNGNPYSRAMKSISR